MTVYAIGGGRGPTSFDATQLVVVDASFASHSPTGPLRQRARTAGCFYLEAPLSPSRIVPIVLERLAQETRSTAITEP